MSKEIIEKIKEAEAEANLIKNSAREEARVRVQTAQTEGKRMYEVAQRQTQELNSQRLKLTQEKADELIDDVRKNALDEAQKMREQAEFNMREAIRFIMAGVKEQCQ